MLEIENDLNVINEQVSDLFTGASLIKFSYSGIYTFEFDLPREVYGFNYFYLDIGTQFSVFEIDRENPFTKPSTIESIFSIWSRSVSKVFVDNDYSLSIIFDNNYCCKVTPKLSDTDRVFDMRWSIYQNQDLPSFYLLVSNEKKIYLQTP